MPALKRLRVALYAKDLRGALDGSGDDGENADSTTQEEEETAPVDQSKIDYQLARALDLIRGVSVIRSAEARIMSAIAIPYEDRAYRPCVGIFLLNAEGKLFAGRRIDNRADAWQMPRNGIDHGEHY